MTRVTNVKRPLPTLPMASPAPAEVCPPCARCCRYVSIAIDPPSTVRNVSTALWLLYHDGISIYEAADGGGWFLILGATCEHLTPAGLCGTYETRPLICREYDVVGCEGTSDEPSETVRFDDARAFVRWLGRFRPELLRRCRDAGIVPERLI